MILRLLLAGLLFAFQDPRIDESSGLVDLGGTMVTTNDSGDSARVFVVDPGSGETVGVTDFSARTLDVEALAPAGPAAVWVGDIGDNARSRDDVTVYRVPVARSRIDVPDPEHYRLVYPDGAHDAEALLVDRAGRLHLVTKSFTGGAVYRTAGAPRATGTNELEKVAELGDYVTDAALLGGGRFALVRGLGQASVYTFPAFERVGTFLLPHQRQGEGVSVGPGDRIRLSSEGIGSAVLEVALPAAVERAMRAPSPVTTTPLPPRRSEESGAASTTWLGWAVAGVAVLLAAGLASLTASRRRGRRTP